MKKILLFSLLLTSLYADAKIYMGVGGGIYNETLNNTQNTSISAPFARVKIGYGNRDAFAIEFSLDYVDNTEKLFLIDDGAKYGMNVELVKAFDFDIFMNPFVKAGFGMGYLETTYIPNRKSRSYGTYNLGVGTYIPINEHLDFEISYDYKYISYQKERQTIDTDVQKSMSHAGYIGINVRF